MKQTQILHRLLIRNLEFKKSEVFSIDRQKKNHYVALILLYSGKQFTSEGELKIYPDNKININIFFHCHT